jgi:membrane protease YdiL (CAAX protease family)
MMTGIISLLAILTGTLIYYHLLHPKKTEAIFLSPGKEYGNILYLFFVRKMAGFIFFGLIPWILVFNFLNESPYSYGLHYGRTGHYPYLLVIPMILPFAVYFLAKNPSFYASYPEMRLKEWTKSDTLVTILSWIIYLSGYEFVFRGLLLFHYAAASGTAIAVAINVLVYAAAHLPKGRQETLGAVPFGLLLCTLALLTDSVLLPFLVHLSLALSTELFSIRHNPGMKFI